jgi:hypothetical protein
VDDASTIESNICLKRIAHPKTIGIDSQQLLLASRQQESDRRFVRGFRRHHVALAGDSRGSPATALAFIETFGAVTTVSALEHALIP